MTLIRNKYQILSHRTIGKIAYLLRKIALSLSGQTPYSAWRRTIVQQIFIIYSCYNSLIVAVIGMFLIRFAGAYTAAAAETVSNTTIIA